MRWRKGNEKVDEFNRQHLMKGERGGREMKMKIILIEKGWTFHWLPCCVAETASGGVLKGKNFMWLKWLFCF